MSNVNEEIAEIVKSSPVVLFMKGNRRAPQCGFSAKVVAALEEYPVDYTTVDVLSVPGIRDGIKTFSSWPTIPQLYVKGTFVGGCDIVTEMSQNGELDDVLGAKKAELKMPEMFVTPGALAKLREFGDGGPIVVRLEVTARWEYGLDFDAVQPGDIVVKGPDWTAVMDRSAARKADGLTIDFVEGPEGSGFKIDNPNEPPKVNQTGPAQVKDGSTEASPSSSSMSARPKSGAPRPSKAPVFWTTTPRPSSRRWIAERRSCSTATTAGAASGRRSTHFPSASSTCTTSPAASTLGARTSIRTCRAISSSGAIVRCGVRRYHELMSRQWVRFRARFAVSGGVFAGRGSHASLRLQQPRCPSSNPALHSW